jgi:hypothetical protein
VFLRDLDLAGVDLGEVLPTTGLVVTRQVELLLELLRVFLEEQGRIQRGK